MRRCDPYLNQFSNKNGVIGKLGRPKRHPIRAACPCINLLFKYHLPPWTFFIRGPKRRANFWWIETIHQTSKLALVSMASYSSFLFAPYRFTVWRYKQKTIIDEIVETNELVWWTVCLLGCLSIFFQFHLLYESFWSISITVLLSRIPYSAKFSYMTCCSVAPVCGKTASFKLCYSPIYHFGKDFHT